MVGERRLEMETRGLLQRFSEVMRPPPLRASDDPEEHIDLLLVCSSGGHLLQLHALREVWEPFRHVWVTFDKSDAGWLLKSEPVVHAYGPTNRNMGLVAAANLVRNLRLAWRLLGSLRPAVMLTTGAGVAVPFAWIGRLRGTKVVYVESLTRIDRPSLSCRLIRPVSDRIYVQWPELRDALPGARYAGTVFGGR
jgi:beta-1,4-N-acetylglucosaminyltransferase